MPHSLSEALTLPAAVEAPHGYTHLPVLWVSACLLSIHVVLITREVKPSFHVFMGCLGFLFHAGDFAWIFIGLFVFLLLILLRALPATLPNRMKHHPSCT